MALTDERSVLVIGAGASVPFGLPTGEQLIENIASSLAMQIGRFTQALTAQDSPEQLFQKFPINAFRSWPYLQPLLWKVGALGPGGERQKSHQGKLIDLILQETETLTNLVALLNNQTSDSIDDFIVLNPTYKELVKICIAAEFVLKLYSPIDHENGQVLNKLAARNLSTNHDSKNAERNWIHRLINLVRLGVSEGIVTKDNKIQIVTFNYDTILEHVLEQQFANIESTAVDLSDYRNYIEIVHVHGQCGKLKQQIVLPSETVWQWSQGIHVIREDDGTIPEEVKAARDRAREIVSNAEQLYFCGFAFAKANTDLIGLAPAGKYHPDLRRSVYYYNHDGDIGIRQAVASLQASNSAQWGVTPPNEVTEMGIANWIGIGTLGELP